MSSLKHNERHPEEKVGEDIQPTASDFVLFDIRTLAHIQEERPFVQVLSDIGVARIILFAFKAGQQLKEHHTSSQILVQVLRGRITCTMAQKDITLQAGMVLQVEASVFHNVVAQTDAVMLLTMLPGPAHSGSALKHSGSENGVPLVTRLLDDGRDTDPV